MQNHTLVALSGRDIRAGVKYILVRITYCNELVVNVMEVVTTPTFDRQLRTKKFMARGLFVNKARLSAEEGAPIELSLIDIGCPWKGSRADMSCRTFTYREVEHDMVVDHVKDNVDLWRKLFRSEKCVIHYTISTYPEGLCPSEALSLL